MSDDAGSVGYAARRAARAGRRATFRRVALAAAASLAAALAPHAFADAAPDPAAPPAADASAEARWATLRTHYFGTADILPGDDVIALEAPPRAHDAAVVPVAIRALDPATAIRRVHLIVDQNPLPLAGIFTFAEEGRGWARLETRIRINEYTTVRAVAELEDGSLVMVARFVKASGGCSAPAMADLDAALARAGRMQLLIADATAAVQAPVDGVTPLDRPLDGPLAEVTMKISHPNNSGMQFDQVSRNYIPAFFVQRIGADIDGKSLVDIETNFSLSENPVIALSFPAGAAHGTLEVHALDSKGNRYEKSAAFTSGS